MATNHGSIEFLKFPNPQYPGDDTKLIKKWLRDSWARRKILALQQAIAAIVVPTKTSDLTNDSGFITQADVPPGSTASSTTPKMDGTASVGTETAFARGDHRHPTDTSRQAALSSAQMEAVNSGITSAKVAAYDAIEVPTKTSDLVNDSGFITGYTETDPTVPAWAKASTKPSYTASEVGALPDTTVIPSKTSDLTNDSGFITGYTETDPTVPNWAKQSTKPSYTAAEVGALPNTTYIPTKTSDLTNDSGFITSYTETDPTVPAWAKSATKPTYTASEVGALPDDTVIPTVPTNISAFQNDVGYITGFTETDPTVPAWAKASTKPTYTASEVGALPDTTEIPSKTSDLTNDSDFQTGTQVSNAISAEAGLMVPYGYCTIAAGTVAKTVTVSPAVTALTAGLCIVVKFQYANTATNPTLNVNGLGAKAIKRYGTTAAGTSAAANWNANSVVMLVYDGTYWMLADWNNTTYSGMTDAEYQAGTSTTNRLITPARLKAAIELHAPVQSVNGQDGDVTIAVPTKTSDLTNDSGFITSAPVTSVNGQTGAVTINVPTKTSDLTNDSGYITSAPVQSVNGQTGVVSLDAADVGALPDSTAIPSKTSQLTNDSGFITSAPVTSVNGKTGAVSLDASDVSALPASTAIPSKTSDLTNDAGYITDAALGVSQFTSLSPYNSRCTVTAGGYAKVGKIVFIDIVLTTHAAASETAFTMFLSGNTTIKPLKGTNYTVLTAVNTTTKSKATKAIVNTAGSIFLSNAAADEVIYITGSYLATT